MLGMRIAVPVRLGLAVLALGAFTGIAGAQDLLPLMPAMSPPAPPAPSGQTTQPPAAVQIPPTAQTVPGIQTAAAPASATPETAAPAAQPLPAGKIDQLIAPVALYPDPLLSQVLMASTYPLELVEAARWIRVPANRTLTGDALTEALKPKNWDPSIMALVAFPRVLSLMADKLEWTEQLGDAFLAQQADVMAAVQRLRHQAMAAGNLKVTPQCHCVIQTSGETISILPSTSQLVCVPVYNPRVIYGAWAEPAYPPDIFPVPVGFAYEPGFAIGFGPVVELAAFGPLWGWSSIDWSHHYISVDNGRLGVFGASRAAIAGGVWVHDPAHRRSVAYRDPAVTGRFGAARVAAVTGAGRMAFAHPEGGAAGAFGPRHSTAFAPGSMGRHEGPHALGSGRFGGGPHASGQAHFAGTAHAFGPHGGGPRGGVAAAHFSGGPHGGGAPHGGGPQGGGHEDHHH